MRKGDWRRAPSLSAPWHLYRVGSTCDTGHRAVAQSIATPPLSAEKCSAASVPSAALLWPGALKHETLWFNLFVVSVLNVGGDSDCGNPPSSNFIVFMSYNLINESTACCGCETAPLQWHGDVLWFQSWIWAQRPDWKAEALGRWFSCCLSDWRTSVSLAPPCRKLLLFPVVCLRGLSWVHFICFVFGSLRSNY